MTDALQTHDLDVPFQELKRDSAGDALLAHLVSQIASDADLERSTPSVRYPRCREVLELADHFYEAHKAGHRLYFATMTYTASSLSPLTPRGVATNLEHFYTALLRYAIHPHNYWRRRYRPLQPIMYAFLDVGGSKHKHSLSIALKPKFASDDLHHHAILIVKPTLAAKFDDLCAYNFERAKVECSSPNAHVKTFHIEPIDPTPESIAKCVDYASFFARTHRTRLEQTDIILPNAEIEFGQRRQAMLSAATMPMRPHRIVSPAAFAAVHP